MKHYTLRVRAIGPQTIHLPEDVILKDGNWCGICGVTQALTHAYPVAATAFSSGVTFSDGYCDSAIPVYREPNITNWTCKGDDPTGVQTIIPYSSATENRAIGFNYWQNVKYTAGAGNGKGRLDFTNATLATGDNYLNLTLVVRGDAISKLEDLWCSITGDSISTYRGVISSNSDFGVTVNQAGNNAIFYPDSGSGQTLGVDSTWWGALIKQTRMKLLRNDAWSGSKVTGTDSTTNSSACASTIRASMLRNTQVTQYMPVTDYGATTYPYGGPDIIFCMIGTNDLAGNVQLGSYSNTQPTAMTHIIPAFELMIARHKQNYPQAKLVYFMIPRGSSIYPFVNSNNVSISDMAEAMEKTAKALGVHFVPLNYFNSLSVSASSGQQVLFTTTTGKDEFMSTAVTNTNQDYLHPSATGHQIIANALQTYCESHL